MMQMPSLLIRRGLLPAALLLAGVEAGCTLAPSAAESQAGRRVAQVGEALGTADRKPALPALGPATPLPEYVRYAVLNHPRVRAAYAEWKATVAAIAPNRALPDPQFTFEADIADTLMTLMPGLMFDVMTAGKRAAMAREAEANSGIAHRAFVAEVLGVAGEVRKAWVDVAYVNEAQQLRADTIGWLDRATAMANADYITGRGMATLEVQVRLANEAARVRSELQALEARRAAAHRRLKSALGLAPAEPDPAWPEARLAATVLPDEDELWRRTLASNPDLGRMRAMVDMAIAGVEVARKAGTPDFTVGGMVDLKADPRMYRPTATVTLPIWREKIRANLTAAEARRQAAAARVDAEQLNMAAQLAQMLYMVRESERMIAYIEQDALPNYERAIATVEAGYQSGMTSPGMVAETHVMAAGMRLERAAALRDRELAVTDLLLMTANVVPEGISILAAADDASGNPSLSPR